MADHISWFATAATIMAALVTASNLGARITGYGFVIFLFGSLAWLATGLLSGQPALTWTNAILTLLNLWGIWRWLGREAKLEEGGEAALEDSADERGEAIFPSSRLRGLTVKDRSGKPVAVSVDAMIGGASGRIHYLVASEGGIAGVGEQLHRVDWRFAGFRDDAIMLTMTKDQFSRLPRIEKDHWPAR